MKTLREAAQQALDALHLWHWTKQTTGLDAAHDALRDAILEPDHTEDHLEMVKPVAWMLVNAYGEADDITYEDPMGDLPEGWTCRPLYTQPPRREWLGLTHEERAEICKDFVGDDDRVGAYLSLALEVEVRLTEKNRSEE